MSDVSDPGQGSEQERARTGGPAAGQPEAALPQQAPAPEGTPGQPAGEWQAAPPNNEGQAAGTPWPGYQGYGPDQGAAPGWYYRPNSVWDSEGQAGTWDPSRAGGYWGQGPNGTQQWPWSPPPAPPGMNRRERRRRHRLTAAVAGAAVVAGAAAGVGIGHVTWAGSPATPTAASIPAGSGSTSGGSGSAGSGSSGGGFSGLNPSGPGNSGSTGSGSAGSGSSGFGRGGFGGNGYGGSGPGGYYGGSGSGGSGSGNGSVSTSPGSPSDVSAIDRKVSPGLVDINLTLGYQNDQAAGTGMVLTSSGEVLTNNHVVDGATSISVTDLANSKTYSAKVVGYDATADVAVLQLVGASNLQTVSLGDSAKAAVGEAVVGIGNAGGSGGTPSAAGGAITALNQSITASDQGNGGSEELTGLIGTNADIQEGDSGGPLVNSSGQVIGMDTAGSSSNNSAFSATTGTTQTVGYAIPINTALAVAKQITSGQGSATVHIGPTGFLGIGVQPAGQSGGFGGFGGFGGYGGGYTFGPGSSGSGSNGSGSSGATSGAEIANVVNGSAAAQAGLEAGDVITRLDGQTVASPTDLSKLLVPHHPGDKLQVTYTDTSGQSHTVTVTLASGPPA